MKKVEKLFSDKNRHNKQTSVRKPKKYQETNYATGIYGSRDFSNAKISRTSFFAA